MNTFLPFRSFTDSAAALDRLRLWKQRLEVLQMLIAMRVPERKGWRNHPCTLAWMHHPNALVAYGVAVCLEWTKRGYTDNLLHQIKAHYIQVGAFTLDDSPRPAWTYDARVHDMYRRRLITKDRRYYTWKFPAWGNLPELSETDWSLLRANPTAILAKISQKGN